MDTHYTPTYDEVLALARTLSPAGQLRLLEALAAMLRHALFPEPLHDVTELRGLGNEVWHGMDAQGYVNQERMSWNG